MGRGGYFGPKKRNAERMNDKQTKRIQKDTAVSLLNVIAVCCSVVQCVAVCYSGSL